MARSSYRISSNKRRGHSRECRSSALSSPDPTDRPIELRGITKRFGAVTALNDAGIVLERGTVSAIVGENGAGKSTLAKIIAGILPKDAGEILCHGKPVAQWSRQAAIAAGIGFVPQTLSVISTLTLVENHLLAMPGWRLDRRKAARRLSTAAETMGVRLNLSARIGDMSLAERQIGEIVSAIAAGAHVLLLDEPTSALGPVEVSQLITLIRRLASEGTTIGLVTHRISEVLEGADHITVLRAGSVVLDSATKGLDAERVAGLMVGDRSRETRALRPVTSDWQRLNVRGLNVSGEAAPILDGISFNVRSGEILGIAGVSGAMQPALAECLAGLQVPDRGDIRIDGEPATGDPARATELGLAYIPEDRLDGLAPDLTNAENASLLRLSERPFQRFGLRRHAAETALGRDIIARFEVRPPDPLLKTGGLSGGNQQKLLVGRELERNPGVVVAHGPTQGLDLAAAAAIRGDLVAAAEAGAAVVVISADLDELIAVSHRLLVLANGRISAEFDLAKPLDMAALGRAMAGTDPSPQPVPEPMG